MALPGLTPRSPVMMVPGLLTLVTVVPASTAKLSAIPRDTWANAAEAPQQSAASPALTTRRTHLHFIVTPS
jgi:hypothetical protein